MTTTHSPCLVSIGPADQLLDHTILHLQNRLCRHRQQAPNQPCRCHLCTGIAEQQSAFVTWLRPSKEYVLKDLDPLFATIRFALEPGTEHFFVIQDAQLLTPTCANRLLKVLEEPPTGYSFILLTNDYHALLATIQSRSTVLFEAAHDTPTVQGLLAFYADPKKLNDPVGLDTALKTTAPTTSQAHLLVQQLAISIDYAAFRQPEALKDLLEMAQRCLPQSGGAHHYLRWLYLHMHALEQ